MKKAIVFLNRNMTRNLFCQCESYQKHECAVCESAEVAHLWKKDASNNIRIFWEYVEDEWLIVPSNTQFVECWMKNTNECTFTNKDKHLPSLMAIYQLDTLLGYFFDET